MSGSTPELALKTAVDADDTADYLTLSLASSLQTLDALFNNISGHSHSGAHQGGPVTALSGSITVPPGGLSFTGGAVSMTDLSVSNGLTADHLGVIHDLTVAGNASAIGGIFTLGMGTGAQGQLQLLHPNGHVSRQRGGPSGMEWTDAAGAVVILSLDDVGDLVSAGNLQLSTAAGASIRFGDAQMIAAGATYIQTNGKLALGTGPTGYRLVLPNTPDGNGQVIANDFIKYSSIQDKTNIMPIADALEVVLDPRVRAVRYTPVNGQTQLLGFLAEEWVDVEPSVVSHAEDGALAGVSYDSVSVLTFAAVRALAERVSALEAKTA